LLAGVGASGSQGRGRSWEEMEGDESSTGGLVMGRTGSLGVTPLVQPPVRVSGTARAGGSPEGVGELGAQDAEPGSSLRAESDSPWGSECGESAAQPLREGTVSGEGRPRCIEHPRCFGESHFALVG